MTRPTLRLTAAATAALLPLGVLAGCGEDDPEPKFEDPPSAGPSGSDSESPERLVEPEPPAAMEKANTAGAKAFVEYYFESLDHAIESGEVALLESLGAPICKSCANLVDTIERTNRNSGRIAGGLHDVRTVAFTRLPSGDERTVTFQGGGRIRSTPQEISGSGVKDLDGTYPGGVSSYSFTVQQTGSRWQMSEWIVQ